MVPLTMSQRPKRQQAKRHKTDVAQTKKNPAAKQPTDDKEESSTTHSDDAAPRDWLNSTASSGEKDAAKQSCHDFLYFKDTPESSTNHSGDANESLTYGCSISQ